MPPRAPRKQYQRAEKVLVVGDANNNAFKATNIRKRPSTKPQPSIEKETIEIDSDNETSQPPKKSRPDPRSSTGRIRGANQEESPAASKPDSEISDRPRDTIHRLILRPELLHQPFADKDADIYISLAPKDNKHTYRIHSHVLMHASSWFKSPILSGVVHEADPGLAALLTQKTGIKYRFELIHDMHFGHFVLKRVSLTKRKPVEQLPEVLPEGFAANGFDGQYYLSNGASSDHHSSMGMPQYDGSFDEAGLENMVGSLDGAFKIHVAKSNSFSGTNHPQSNHPVNRNQDKEDAMKLEEGIDMQLTSAEIIPTPQMATTEKIATPPTSPTKIAMESDNENTKHDNQIQIDFQNAPERQNATPIETPFKAESRTEEQVFLHALPTAQASKEEQLENLVKTQVNPEEQPQQGGGSTQLPPSRQASAEEQLQMDISTKNQEKPEIKLGEPPKAVELPVQVSSSAKVSPIKEIDEPEKAELAIKQPQQATGLSFQESSNDRVLLPRENAVSTRTNLIVEIPQKALRKVSPVLVDAQRSSKEKNQVPANTKTMEAKHQSKTPPVVEEASKIQNINKPEVSVIAKSNLSASEQDMRKQSNEQVHSDVLDAYDSLFRCFYSFPPTISTSDMPTALKQSTILIKIATLYHSLQHVRPHIIASLLSHGRNLCSSIRQDPPRLLILANKLQCALIFKEALIHIVGQAPSWPWPTPQDRIDPTLSELIRDKLEDLKDKKAEANEALFRSCLAQEGVRVSINNLDKTTFDMWVVVQIWHDWFSQQLHTCAVTRRDENRSVERNMYKLMAQGGDAYLKIDDIMAMVKPYRAVTETREWGNWDKNQVEKQMQIMKEFAAKTVKDLMANELMGDISDNGEAIEYLTCTKVYESELPWVAVTLIAEDERED